MVENTYLSFGLRLNAIQLPQFGTRQAALCKAPEIESKLRLAFSRKDFEKTATFETLQTWQANNEPFKCWNN